MSRNLRHERKLLPFGIVMFLGLTVSATGQVRMPPGQPPQRTAFLQYMSGEVSVAPSATNDWAAARLNQPLMPSEYVWTATNSRAEINVGGGFIRMNSEASLTLVALNPGNVQVSVNQGEVSLTVFRLPPGEIYEIDTPNASLTVTKTGVYRVEVKPAEEKTLVTTRKGSIVATGREPAVTISSGQQVTFVGGNSLQHTAQKAPPPDGFEDWASIRDKRLGVTRPPFGVVVGYGPYPYGAIAVPAPAPPPY
jgi:ferric-dicitrate binding protein FerR (iron transport regulator)